MNVLSVTRSLRFVVAVLVAATVLAQSVSQSYISTFGGRPDRHPTFSCLPSPTSFANEHRGRGSSDTMPASDIPRADPAHGLSYNGWIGLGGSNIFYFSLSKVIDGVSVSQCLRSGEVFYGYTVIGRDPHTDRLKVSIAGTIFELTMPEPRIRADPWAATLPRDEANDHFERFAVALRNRAQSMPYYQPYDPNTEDTFEGADAAFVSARRARADATGRIFLVFKFSGKPVIHEFPVDDRSNYPAVWTRNLYAEDWKKLGVMIAIARAERAHAQSGGPPSMELAPDQP